MRPLLRPLLLRRFDSVRRSGGRGWGESQRGEAPRAVAASLATLPRSDLKITTVLNYSIDLVPDVGARVRREDSLPCGA